MNAELDASSLLVPLAVTAVLGAVLYVYSAIIISILARKTGTPDAWMAWIPVANMVLLCRIGQRPALAILGLLIPIVNIFVLVYVFLGVARVRAKPAIAAYLMLVPLVNLVALAWLASGDAPANRSGSQPLPPPRRQCPHCGEVLDPAERFCGGCGQLVSGAPYQPYAHPAQQAPAAPAPAASSKVPAVMGALFSMILVAAGGWYGVTRFITPKFGGAGASSTSPIAQRRSGALTEFPVDTDQKSPAKPVSVSTAQFNRRQPAPPIAGLPAGITANSLRNSATSVSSATYQASPSESPVTVHVIEAQAPDSLEATLSQSVLQSAGGVAENTGVQVASPTGQIYRGRKIRSTLGAVVYILAKTGAAVLILIYSPQAGGAPVAERLAANVGNGAGLYDYAGVAGAVTLLPAPPPAGLILTSMTSYAGSDLVNLEDLRRSLGADAEAVKPYIPDRIVTARYADTANREWKLIAGDYGGVARAWLAWSALRMSSGLTGLQSVPIPNGDGLTLTKQGERYLICRDGSRLILVIAPAAEEIQRLVSLSANLQL